MPSSGSEREARATPAPHSPSGSFAGGHGGSEPGTDPFPRCPPSARAGNLQPRGVPGRPFENIATLCLARPSNAGALPV